MLWRVGTSLRAVAFAEPCQCGLFRVRGFTEPAWPFVLVPPLRTRRADFPHRAPQVAFHFRRPFRQMHDGSPHTAVRTTNSAGDSTRTAGDAGCVGAAPESTAERPRALQRPVAVCSDAIRSTDRSHAASPSVGVAGLAASSADAQTAIPWCASETSGNS